MKVKSAWVQKHLLHSDPLLPFSFIYDGKPSFELLKTGQKKTETKKLDKNRTQYNHIWTDSKTGLEVRCVSVEYSDYPVIEWTVYFRNTGSKDTPVLKDIQGLDIAFQRSGEGEFVLNGIKGDFCTADSYAPYQLTLGPDFVKTFAPSSSGKSSDGPDGWPYYNLQTPAGGFIIAVGWPGQWASSFTRDNLNGLVVRAGQQTTNLYLKPGEEIRTPMIAMLFWQGTEVVKAQNLWRRYYLAHVLPQIDGIPQQPVMQIQAGGAITDTAYVNAFHNAGIFPDVSWRDAGGAYTWYPSKNGPYKGNDAWLNTGTWEIDSTLYPDGFRAYTDWLHKHKMKFVLWFEPERVGDPNSWLSQKHPEWLLPGTSHGALLDEGNPEALEWLINHVDEMIKSQGIDWYREDMNGGGPLPAWRKNDAPNRKGITENFYVQGYLAFWDELKRRNPQLRIDACASGGRRNDLETMRRAVPLLRSDFQWDSMPQLIEGNQGHTYGLSSWLPFQGTGVYSYDTYSYRSFYIPGFGMGGLTPENTAAQKQAYSECREIAPSVLFGDYYPLTPYSLQPDQWIAWQFYRTEQGTGVIQVFRRSNCDDPTKVFRLNGLDTEAQYEVVDFDVKGSTKISGKELMEKGLTKEIKDKPGAAVITYQRLN
jgi:alpha-galactosidase